MTGSPALSAAGKMTEESGSGGREEEEQEAEIGTGTMAEQRPGQQQTEAALEQQQELELEQGHSNEEERIPRGETGAERQRSGEALSAEQLCLPLQQSLLHLSMRGVAVEGLLQPQPLPGQQLLKMTVSMMRRWRRRSWRRRGSRRLEVQLLEERAREQPPAKQRTTLTPLAASSLQEPRMRRQWQL